MKTIFFATNNQNKVKEISNLLGDTQIKTFKDFNLKDPIENGLTFEENSKIKAIYGFENTNLPTIADDSGFYINCLNGFPGVVSKRFIDSLEDKNKIFQIINSMVENYDKKCSFITNFSFVYKDKNNNIVTKSFEGKIEGKFVFPARGSNGFGYDPVFVPDGYTKTFAEMTLEEKAKMSHRTIALNEFLKYFKKIN